MSAMLFITFQEDPPAKYTKVKRHRDWMVESSTVPSNTFLDMIDRAASTYELMSLTCISAECEFSMYRSVRASNEKITSGFRSFNVRRNVER